MKKLLCVLLCCLMIGSFCAACAEGQPIAELEHFSLRNGSRDSKKIAITMDDAFEREYVQKSVDLCRRYGITMTFFPVGFNLHEEERDIWLDVLDAGCEIGSHTQHHNYIRDIARTNLLAILGKFQENLDKVLGFHYEVRWLRPPFGHLKNSDGSSQGNIGTIREFGYDHVVLWDVDASESDINPDLIFEQVRNGSILLFHARHKDYVCLEKLIPQLLDAGWQPVTLSELFGFDPPATGGDLYTVNLKNYEHH
jgi:peptidoglycan/xylan/chitin deacetylase (PgdA/CDA1 family)